VDEKEEIGYPHEIILFSINKAPEIIKGKYNNRLKIITSLFMSIIGKNVNQEIEPSEEDIFSMILYNLKKDSKVNITELVSKYQNQLEKKIRDFNRRQSEPAYSALEKFIVDSIFYHILTSELSEYKLLPLNNEVLLTIFTNNEELNTIIDSLLIFMENKKYTKKTEDIAISLSNLTNEKLIESAIFISYRLAIKTSYKKEFLYSHYRLLRKSMDKLYKIIKNPNLDDSILEKIMKLSIILYLCGYDKSLRLPHEEKLNYIDKVISIPTIIQKTEKALDKNLKFRHKLIPIDINISILLFIVLILNGLYIVIPQLQNLKITIKDIPIKSVSFPLPFPIDAPLLPIISTLILIIIIKKIYNLKENIIKEFKGGKND